MIARYTRPAMGQLWREGERFRFMLEVEREVARVQGRMGLIPKAAARAIQKNSRYELGKILEIEKVTRHDVIAFVSEVARNVGPQGRFIHYGLTSSDVVDTAFNLQIAEGGQILLEDVGALKKTLRALVVKTASVLMAGRTHGMHAETTSLGFKLAGFLAELHRCDQRLRQALERCRVGKLSGAVGTFSAFKSGVGQKFEREVCSGLGLRVEPVATQVIPRDRHAELMAVFALFGGFIERIAVELRHLQRTEVGEVIEGFQKGQKGSSAMPHKKNPISAENLTGQARLLRSYALAAFENQALWHERDISHSSVERVIFPDAFTALDYALDRLNQLMKGLTIDGRRMKVNRELSQGRLASSQVLLALVDQGLTREKAYEIVQRASHGANGTKPLDRQLLADPEVKAVMKARDIQKIFSETHLQKKFKDLVKEALVRISKDTP
jgi:adenylosuccinate lyase